MPEISTTAGPLPRGDRQAAARAPDWRIRQGWPTRPMGPRQARRAGSDRPGQTAWCSPCSPGACSQHEGRQQPRTEIGQPNGAQVATGCPGQADEDTRRPVLRPVRRPGCWRRIGSPAATGSRSTRPPPRPALRRPATTAGPGHPDRGWAARPAAAGRAACRARSPPERRPIRRRARSRRRARTRPPRPGRSGRRASCCQQQRDAAADPGVERGCRAVTRSRWRIRPVTSSAAPQTSSTSSAPSTARGRSAGPGRPAVGQRRPQGPVAAHGRCRASTAITAAQCSGSRQGWPCQTATCQHRHQVRGQRRPRLIGPAS